MAQPSHADLGTVRLARPADVTMRRNQARETVPKLPTAKIQCYLVSNGDDRRIPAGAATRGREPTMADFNDLNTAQIALANPATSGADLALIAQLQPSLRAAIALHPSAYTGLLDWLAALGDPAVVSAVQQRRAYEAARQAPGGGASAGAAVPGFVPPAAASAPYAPAYAPTTGKPARRKSRSKPIVAAGVGVVVLALVTTGLLTRGFGLFPAGGSASPKDAGIVVAGKVFAAVNSFSAENVLDNPLKAFSALSDEIAPSEKQTPQLLANTGIPNLRQLAGITPDSTDWLTKFVGAFKVDASGLATQVTQITDDVAFVRYTGGTLTMTANVAQLRDVMNSTPDIVKTQFESTLNKYGISSNLGALIDQSFQPGWQDEFIESVEENFPYVMDLDRLWSEAQQCNTDVSNCNPSDWNMYDSYRQISGIVVVREGGRWYLSPLMTSQSINADFLPSDDLARFASALTATPAQHDTAASAAQGLITALNNQDSRAIMRELPLAERRYMAWITIGGGMNGFGDFTISDASFTEIANSGGFAKLRIDNLVLSNDYSSITVTNGTCVASDYVNGCLKDVLDTQLIGQGFDYLRQNSYGWDEIQQQTGIDMNAVLDKLQNASTAAVNAINPDDIGVVAVHEGDGWYVTVMGTFADLQQQLSNAATTGLDSVAVR